MSLTPLFTSAELDEAITALKTAYVSLASGTNQEYSIDTGMIKKTFVKKDLEKISQQLEWLQEQRSRLELGGGPQVLTGRPKRCV